MPDHPRSVEEYLAQLRAELAGADPALIQDVLGDAEDYLRSELALLPPGQGVAGLAAIIERYGSPAEVAEANRQTERLVQAALRQYATPPPGPARPEAPREAATPDRVATARRRPEGFLAVLVDPRAYTAFFFMLLSLFTGILYFTWVVTGLSLSAGFLVLIIGIPFFLLFVATVRVLAFVEGRIIESLLGVRMPRRPPLSATHGTVFQRAKARLVDWRTWTTMLYMILTMPLGILYFTIFVTLTSIAAGLLFYPFAQMVFPHPLVTVDTWTVDLPPFAWPLVSLLGFVVLVVTLHLARGVGTIHASFAKGMLVHTP